MSDISDLYSNEHKSLTENHVKYYIFTAVLDYLLANKWYCGKDAVSVSAVKEWLAKRGTKDYMCGVSAARTELWLHELLWLRLVTLNEDKQQLSLTEEGYKACQDQRYHSIYACLTEAKHTRHLTYASVVIAIVSVIVAIIALLV